MVALDVVGQARLPDEVDYAVGAVLDGELGFTRVAKYKPKYLWPRKHFLGIAGWPEKSVTRMDIAMSIYKKDSVK